MQQLGAITVQISIVQRLSAGVYSLEAQSDGQLAYGEFELDAHLLTAIEQLWQGQRVPASSLGGWSQKLGQLLTPPEIWALLEMAQIKAAEQKRPLQIQLDILPPELVPLPWECLSWADDSWLPALEIQKTLVRVATGLPPIERLAVSGPLRILAIASSSQALHIEALQRALQQAQAQDLIQLQVLQQASPQQLELTLLTFQPHILHCAAEISLSETGFAQLELSQPLSALALANLCEQCTNLRLVSLAGAQGDGYTINGNATVLAQNLIANGISAVISSACSLPIQQITQIAAHYYREIAQNTPLDQALAQARHMLVQRQPSRIWGLLQLHLVPQADRLFQTQHATPKPPSTEDLTKLLNIAAPQEPEKTSRSRSTTIASERKSRVASKNTSRVASKSGSRVQSTSDPAGRAERIKRLRQRRIDREIAKIVPFWLVVGIVMMFGLAYGLSRLNPETARRNQAQTLASVPQQLVGTPWPREQIQAYALTTVNEGENILQLSERFQSNPQSIIQLNKLLPYRPLRSGRPIVVPLDRALSSPNQPQLITKGNPDSNFVAITFNVEVNDQSVYRILTILRNRELRATFFVTGDWVNAYPAAAKAIVDNGHEIANHSLNNTDFTTINGQEAISQLEQTEQAILNATGQTGRPYFRFPYGNSNTTIQDQIAQQGYLMIGWGADDAAIPAWIKQAEQNRQAAQGGILLMHTSDSTINSLSNWLDRLIAIGLQPSTLSQALE